MQNRLPFQNESATEVGACCSVLSFTTLFPSAARPNHGIFVENRLRHLLSAGRTECRIVAPVPWFPWKAPRFGQYAAMARTPLRETRHGTDVLHPRYLAIPRVGMTAAPWLLFAGAFRTVWRLRHRIDLIDAHYFYPDGVAAVLLGRVLCKPVVITARGSDINLIPEHALPRHIIRWAAGRAAGIIAVSQALKKAMVEMGIPSEKIVVLRNGVDLEMFRPGDRKQARSGLGVTGKVLLSVGHLVEAKGHELAIAAISKLRNCTLVIAGAGPERSRLEALAASLGVADCIRFLGPVPHSNLRQVYVAADALVLASIREGWPNVLLEAMACGTPVIASPVGGIPEIVCAPEAGVLMLERSAAGIAEAVERLFSRLPRREDTRAYAEKFSWDETTSGQIQLFKQILEKAGNSGARRGAEAAA